MSQDEPTPYRPPTPEESKTKAGRAACYACKRSSSGAKVSIIETRAGPVSMCRRCAREREAREEKGRALYRSLRQKGASREDAEREVVQRILRGKL